MSDKERIDTGGKNKNKKKIYKNIGIIVAILIIVFSLFINYFTKNSLYNGRIGDNVYIEGIEVSSLTKEEAFEKINAKYSPQDINLEHKDKYFEITTKDINLEYNTKNLVDEAYNNTRTGSYMKDIISYINTKTSVKKYTIRASYNEENLEKSIEEIAGKINRKTVDATVSIGSGINITPSTTGQKLETADNKKLIVESINNKKYEPVKLKVTITQPKISTKDVQAIDTNLASFSTSFNASQTGRSYNIGLSASRVNNVILLPGETFSYNDLTGMRTLSNGYLKASVIVAGDYTDAPGGGVCQTSTTMFNAALLSGLEITQVRNHSKTSNYAPRGRDAMVNDGDSDLKFTNNFDHAVYVSCYRSGGSVSAAIYGASEDKVGVSINVDHFTYNGLPGAKTYRTITKNGKSKTSFIYSSVYRD